MTYPSDTTWDDRSVAALTTRADGSLARRRQARLEARLAESPELRAAVERQGRAVDALRSIDVAAPAALRARIEVARADSPRRPPLAVAGGLAAAVAAAALVLVLVLAGGSGGPNVVEASELSARPAQAPAPRSAEPRRLDASAAGLAFPDWAAEFGWRATGLRRDDLDGHRAVTVFYAKEGRTAAYTILSGDPLEPPSGSARATRQGTRFAYFREGERTVVTWKRGARPAF
jgi:hypothetical protein